ncbi:MAG: glycosyltransferase [Hahellaceae bacterium]|nr:glycosyltransferase [Hahellaceae bacterium]MCP5170082.1 glycosyltransferase [Hahellaceae bacterium]
MQKVLVIGYVWPEPASSAAGYRMLSLLETFLAQGWQVTFVSPAQPTEHQIDLASLGVSAQAVRLNCASFDTFVTEMQPDIVLFDRFMMEEQFGWRVEQCCPNALRVLDTEDLHSLRDARHRALKHHLLSGNDATKCVPVQTEAELFASMTGEELTQREVASILRCDLTLMISKVEIELLTQRFGVPASLLHYCPFMIDGPLTVATAGGALPAWQDRAHFICIGNFRHAPNWDAVLWLRQTLWPMIRASLPQAELHIYGAYPPPKATQLHDPRQGFLVKGWAENVDEVMLQARICLAPLRFGAGIKGKLADAMRCGTPSVTTSIGQEGMHDNLPWPGACADDAVQFAQQAVHYYQHAADWQQAQQQGYVLLKQLFDKSQQQALLLDRLASLREQLSDHRRNNFIGAMLRHHHHKSTRYMAQWIEAKNKLREVQESGTAANPSSTR